MLAKLELVEDARVLGADAGRMALFVPFVLVGYGLLMGALAACLAPKLGWAGSLALVGGVNLVGGLVDPSSFGGSMFMIRRSTPGSG